MMSTELKQLNNFITVVGDLKSKNLTQRTAQSNGKEYISGSIVVEVRDGEEIADVEFEVYAMEGSKNYPSVKKLKDEFLSKQEALSQEYVTKIRAIGALEINDFYNREGELISHNRYKLISAYASDNNDKAEMDIDVVITDMKEDSHGKLVVDGFTVGYREEIIELKTNIDIPEDYTEAIKNFYEIGDVAPLKIKIGVAVEENDDVKSFGIVDNKTYRRHWLLLGGTESKSKYTDEMLSRAKTLRESKLNELKQEFEQRNIGMGGGIGFGETADTNEDNPFL